MYKNLLPLIMVKELLTRLKVLLLISFRKRTDNIPHMNRDICMKIIHLLVLNGSKFFEEVISSPRIEFLTGEILERYMERYMERSHISLFLHSRVENLTLPAQYPMLEYLVSYYKKDLPMDFHHKVLLNFVKQNDPIRFRSYIHLIEYDYKEINHDMIQSFIFADAEKVMMEYLDMVEYKGDYLFLISDSESLRFIRSKKAFKIEDFLWTHNLIRHHNEKYTLKYLHGEEEYRKEYGKRISGTPL